MMKINRFKIAIVLYAIGCHVLYAVFAGACGTTAAYFVANAVCEAALAESKRHNITPISQQGKGGGALSRNPEITKSASFAVSFPAEAENKLLSFDPERVWEGTP